MKIVSQKCLLEIRFVQTKVAALVKTMTSKDNDNLKALALKLKDACDPKGQEINPSKSAKIIHQIGLEHFRRSPDKICLIKGVGLLNSAIARNPNNASDIEKDLRKI